MGKLVLDMDAKEAADFFLTSERYCNFNLPPYFSFQKILSKVRECLKDKKLSDYEREKKQKSELDDINYKIFKNKNGNYAWRQFQLIHPAIYVDLVNKMTEKTNWEEITGRFKDFRKNPKVQCFSIPNDNKKVSSDWMEREDFLLRVFSLLRSPFHSLLQDFFPSSQNSHKKKDVEEQNLQGWREYEQKSIELSLDYDIIFYTDISDCYPSIYTHSIPWAIYRKEYAKKNKDKRDIIGNKIDQCIMDMSCGQTNGIPQGSVLMDFIAEIVLGYVDELLSDKIGDIDKDIDYHILRYRDDYRIFVNNSKNGKEILKLLTEVLTELGLKLNSSKTLHSQDVISSSLKKDKLAWMKKKQSSYDLQNHLLLIHQHSIEYPNSRSLIMPLKKFRTKVEEKINKNEQNLNYLRTLISIVIDIAYRNPETYSQCAAILSCMLSKFNEEEKKDIFIRVCKKFSKLPNTSYMMIWLHRISLPIKNRKDFKVFDEKLCKIAEAEKIKNGISEEPEIIWNNKWLDDGELKKIIVGSNIIDREKLINLPEIISEKEVRSFSYG